MADDFTELLKMATRTDERVESIREDIAEIKAKHLKLIEANAQAIGSLKDSRAKARGVLWALSGLITLVGGERVIEWLGRSQ